MGKRKTGGESWDKNSPYVNIIPWKPNAGGGGSFYNSRHYTEKRGKGKQADKRVGGVHVSAEKEDARTNQIRKGSSALRKRRAEGILGSG